MNQALMIAVIIGASLALVGAVSAGAGDLVNSSLSTGKLEVPQLDVVFFDGQTTLYMTVKNTGTATISKVDATITAGSVTSDPISVTDIEKGSSDSIKSQVLEGGSPMITQSGERILVIVNATTVDGSSIIFDPIKTRVK